MKKLLVIILVIIIALGAGILLYHNRGGAPAAPTQAATQASSTAGREDFYINILQSEAGAYMPDLIFPTDKHKYSIKKDGKMTVVFTTHVKESGNSSTVPVTVVFTMKKDGVHYTLHLVEVNGEAFIDDGKANNDKQPWR